MASDPKKKHVDGKRRAITIHDGARLTPALVRLLEGLCDEAHSVAESATSGDTIPTYVLESTIPVLVARSDGLAIYVEPDGRVL